MSAYRRIWPALAAMVAIVGISQVAAAGWIHVKAALAQRLIAWSWAQASAGGDAPRPWPGADLRPVARMTIPRRGVELFVLDSASARTLAFGPAWVAGSAAPGGRGASVVIAHRDTHFAVLQYLENDDEIDVESPGGRLSRYRVQDIAVMHKDDPRLVHASQPASLLLVTCFPFDAVRPGTPLRYVVLATRRL